MQYMPCSSQIISEMLPEIRSIEKVLFSQTFKSFSNDLILFFLSNYHTSIFFQREALTNESINAPLDFESHRAPSLPIQRNACMVAFLYMVTYIMTS